MRRQSRIRCAGCGKRIRPHQPDLLLESVDSDGERPRYFHTTCGKAAYAAAAEKPGAHVLTVRHIEEVAN
jgi:hypothetical protein